MNIRINPRLLRITTLLIGLIGLCVLLYGTFNVIQVSRRYEDLAGIPPPSQEELNALKPGDPTIMSLAGLERDKRELLAERGRQIALLGAGAAIVGVAVFAFLNLPTPQPVKPAQSAQASPAAPASRPTTKA